MVDLIGETTDKETREKYKLIPCNVKKFRYCEFTFMDYPKEGDIVYRKMESGKTGIFRIDDIERPCDPGDQYFYDEVFLGYKGEKVGWWIFKKDLPKATREPKGFSLD